MKQTQIDIVEEELAKIPMFSEYLAHKAFEASRRACQFGSPELDIAVKLSTSQYLLGMSMQYSRV